MKIIDKDVVASFRGLLICEYCQHRRQCYGHHLRSRGAGQLDIRINLISLCVNCHDMAHTGGIDRLELAAIVATREGTTAEAIEDEIFRLRRLPQPRNREREKPLRKKKRRRSVKHEAVLERQREWRKASYRNMKGR